MQKTSTIYRFIRTTVITVAILLFAIYQIRSVVLTASKISAEQGACIANLISLEVERRDIKATITEQGVGSCINLNKVNK